VSADRLGELGTADRRNRNLIWTPSRRNVQTNHANPTTMVSFLATFRLDRTATVVLFG
jgi:hypothetical protein